ncbi:hypothetical protein BJ742DRAFT_164616 [Cladochytrium replicatum]|nr:hypothetical protein BJ742DRAFT_164616 [Cladochytrium replicatum]
MSKSYASNNGSDRQSPPALRGQPDRSSSFPPLGELDISRYDRINDDDARLMQQQQMARLRLNQTLRVSHMKRMPNLTIDTTNPSQRAGGASTSRPAFKSSQLRPIGQSPVSAPGNFFAGYNFPIASPAKTSQDVSSIFASINPYSQSMIGHPLSAAPVENPIELPSSPWKTPSNPIPPPGASNTSPGDSPPLSSSMNGKTRLGSLGKHEGSPSLSNTGAIGSEMRKRNSSYGYMETDVSSNSIDQWSGTEVNSSINRVNPNLSAAAQGPPPGLDGGFSARGAGAQMNAYANAAMQSQYDMQASYDMQNQYDLQAARLLESMTAQMNPYMGTQTARFPGAHNYDYNGREYSEAGVMTSKVLRNRGGGRGRDDGQYVPRQSSAGRSNDINPYNISKCQ